MSKVQVALIGIIVLLLLTVVGLAITPLGPGVTETLTRTERRTSTATTTSVSTTTATTTSVSTTTSITTTTATTISVSTTTATTTSVSTTTSISTTTATTISVSTTTTTTTRITTVTATVTLQGARWEVRFSPRGGAAERLTYWIGRANSTVCAMIYSFTSDDIAAAFIEAKNRGVGIKLVMDDQQLNVQGGEYQNLIDNGVPVRVDKRSNFMHNKVIVIDGVVVVTGSYNWSVAAEEDNRENLLIILDPELASVYQGNCEANWDASTP